MIKILLLFLFIICLTCRVDSIENNFQNYIVAIVNDELITRNELERKKIFLIYQIKQSGKNDLNKDDEKELERMLIDRIIINKLIREEAKKEGVNVSKEEIEERLESVKRRFSNEEMFKESLKETGLSIDDLYESFEYEIILQKIFLNKIRDKIIITPQEIKDFYEEHRNRFREPERIKLRSIFIYKYDRSQEELENRMNEVIKALEENTPFENVAAKYSEGATAFKGGVMEEVKKGELSSRIEEIIFSLKPGEISPWIETESGFYLFKVDDFITGKLLSFEEVQLEIRDILLRKKIEEKFNKWIDTLKEKAFIQINE